jgi:hypothetical protein
MRAQGRPRVTTYALPLLLATAACEHGVDASGTVTIPLPVQGLFDRDRPGVVTLEVQIPSLGTLRQGVAALCDPLAMDRTVPGKLFTLGCARAETAIVTTWAAFAPAGQAVDCTPGAPVPTVTGPARMDMLAADEQQVAVSRYGGLLGCSDGEIPFALTLKGTAQP